MCCIVDRPLDPERLELVILIDDPLVNGTIILELGHVVHLEKKKQFHTFI